MIIAYINGQVAYPSSQGDVKIDLQNPFIKDGDEKTMEIVFPLAIPENREVFGHIERLDTSFESEDFENVRLMAEGNLIIEGVGTITQITPMEIRLQILSGKSYLRYKSSFDHIFIDQLDYGQVAEKYQRFASSKTIQDVTSLSTVSDISNKGFIGEAGKYVFMPIHDEGENIWANAPAFIYSPGRSGTLLATSIVMAAVQPNLMMVFRKVMDKLGYSIVRNDFDVAPWNKLYVASARVSLSMAKALPHWSCYKFLDEFRKLFNAAYIFDESNKTVTVTSFGSINDGNTVEIEPVDEFSSTYNEEGLEYLEASNIQYELSDCERTIDVVSEELRNMFEVREYESTDLMSRAFDNLTVKEKLTSLFHCPTGWFYGAMDEDENSSYVSYSLKNCGWFSPLIRKEGAAYVSLNIVPAAMAKSECRIVRCIRIPFDTFSMLFNLKVGNFPNMVHSFEGLIVNVNCENQTEVQYFGSSAEKDVEYITVQEVLENGESGPESESDNSTIEVFFVDGLTYRYYGSLEFVERLDYEMDMPDEPSVIIMPVPMTDFRIDNLYKNSPRYSMSLVPSSSMTSIGQFHNPGMKIKRNVNGNNEICVKFVYYGKPDPKKIYIIKNRKFICSHIEMAISNNQLSPLKTGYFYELID